MPKIARKTKQKIVTICSSASFYREAIEAEKALKKMGFKVLLPLTAGKMKKSGDFRVETYKTWFKDKDAYARKTFLTKHHFNKVAQGDIVLVLNYEKNGKKGYIGGAVLCEMALGLHFGKRIFILNPIQEDVSYKEEILGMQPVILNGDLSRLSAK